MDKLKVFISYRRATGGIAFAYIIKEKLSVLDIDCFFDIHSMHNYNEDFEKEIDKNLLESDYVIVLLQNNCFVSKSGKDYFLNEIRLAKENNKQIILLPVGTQFVWEAQPPLPEDLNTWLPMLNLCVPLELVNVFNSIYDLVSNFRKENLYLHYQLLLKMRDAAEKSDRTTLLQKTSDIYYIPMEERWRNAKRVSLMAVGCSSVVMRFYPLIKQKALEGTEFRFLAIDPEGDSADEFSKNKINSNVNGTRKAFLKNNYNDMLRIMQDMPRQGSLVQYSLTSDFITFTMHWVECKNDSESYIYLEFLPIRATNTLQDQHSAAVIKRNAPSYEFYVDQFNVCWNKSKAIVVNEKDSSCEFCCPPEEDNKFIVYESNYWRVYLANNQNYPGRCIIPLLRHCENLSELTDQEWNDFKLIVNKLETGMKNKLGVTNLNWTCLMNGAYGEKPYNPHVHFHLIPRYENEVKTDDGLFKDVCFGNHYTMSTDFQLNNEDRIRYYNILKSIFE